MKKQILALFWTLVAAISAHAQSIGPSTINAAGGGGTIADNSFDWSVGEMTVVSTFASGSVVVTQGVLQPQDGTTGIGIETLQGLNVYPNPASTVVNIQYQAQLSGKLSYSLMDMTGKVIERKQQDITPGSFTTQLNVAPLAAATYMLEVVLETTGSTAKTTSYKIQKLQ